MPTSTETLGPAIPDDVEALVQDVLRTACAGGMSLVTAESCTGGLLASLLTDIDGAGKAFERGFVTYSERSKCELLGIAQADIERCGAVSAEVAAGMARGALAGSEGDIAVAITGFAGPAGPGDEPGLVHLACVRRNGEIARREEHFGDIGRGAVRIAALRSALQMLQSAMAEVWGS